MLKRACMLACIGFSVSAAAQEMTYTDCAAMVDRSPGVAEKKAAAWQAKGGGMSAMHCHAMALFALRRFDEAARILDALGRNHDVPFGDRAAIFEQAGSAWLSAGKPHEAVQSFSAALGEKPKSASVLEQRARARGLTKDWKGADADLSAALAQDMNRADLLVLRASARWALGRKTDFAADIVRALDVYPDYPPALLERGKRKYEAGDLKGARRDWQKVASAGQGQTAADAKRYLAAMDKK